MSEISRILTNLGLAYGLGSKEQFIDAIASYAQDRKMNDEAVKEIIEQVFEEVELTNRRRKAKQAMEAVEMEREAGKKEKVDFSGSEKPSDNWNEMISEIRAMRRSVETLIDKLDKANSAE